RERKRWLDIIERGGVTTKPIQWLDKTENDTLRALRARGEATAAELARDVPALKTQVKFGEDKKWAGVGRASTRVQVLLQAAARVVRGRPRGTWTSSQYRWAPMSSWLPAGTKEPAVAAARATLVEHWLRTYGPGAVADIKWWTGWSVGDVRRA